MLCTPLKKKPRFLTHTLPIFQGKKDVLVHALLEDLKLLSHVPVYLTQEENCDTAGLVFPKSTPEQDSQEVTLFPSRMPCALSMCAGEDSRFGGWGGWPLLKRSLVLALVGRTPDQGTFLFSF